jgi:hypothetical protein
LILQNLSHQPGQYLLRFPVSARHNQSDGLELSTVRSVATLLCS